MPAEPLLIVGGGLAGSLLAREATARGLECRVFDRGEEEAASPAADNLFCREWASAVGGEGRYTLGEELLGRHFTPRRLLFEGVGGREKTLLWIPPSETRWDRTERRAVTALTSRGLVLDNVEEVAGAVVVAAGAWSSELIPDVRVRVGKGHGIFYAGEPVSNRWALWAPYRQSYLYRWADGETRFSDGTSVANYGPEHLERGLRHAGELGAAGAPLRVLYGRRPFFVKGPPPGTPRRVRDGLWLLTGGARSGLAGYAAGAAELLGEILR